jgi:hypothetical protein
MEPPIALSDCLFFLPVTSVADYELGTLRKGSRSDDAGVSQIVADDQIYLASRLRRFLNAYLDSDKSRRADFRKAISFASHQVEIDSPASPTLEEDIATALVIAQKAADIAEATDIDETEDGIGLYSADSDLLLLADAFAALAFVYRYVVGIYATDPALGDLGEVAVGFALLAECEDNMALAATPVAFPVIPLMTSSACTANQEFESVLSMFVPTADQNDVAASLPEVVSRRPKESILLMA